MHRTLDPAAIGALRAIYDLADVDVSPSLDLLAGLLGHPLSTISAQLAQLRRAGLVQRDRLGLTMVGLAVALAAPPTEPVAMSPRLALVAAA